VKLVDEISRLKTLSIGSGEANPVQNSGIFSQLNDYDVTYHFTLSRFVSISWCVGVGLPL
jgi:hypothetical protein